MGKWTVQTSRWAKEPFLVGPNGEEPNLATVANRLNAADEMRTLLGRSLRLIEIFPFPSESDKQLIRAIQDCLHAALTPTSERTSDDTQISP